MPAPRLASAEQRFDDPFQYCAAVKTIDEPDARYSGPPVPHAIARGLQRAFGIAPDQSLEPFERGTYWRCMDGAVYACTVGANLPCQDKPPPDPAPNDAMRTFCSESRDADNIPAYVTGHGTIYEWSCKDGEPVRGKAYSTLDRRGYIANVWHRISTPEPN
jgi:hypothetical protein